MRTVVTSNFDGMRRAQMVSEAESVGHPPRPTKTHWYLIDVLHGPGHQSHALIYVETAERIEDKQPGLAEWMDDVIAQHVGKETDWVGHFKEVLEPKGDNLWRKYRQARDLSERAGAEASWLFELVLKGLREHTLHPAKPEPPKGKRPPTRRTGGAR